MNSYNITGNIANDPELKNVGETSVLNFTVASNINKETVIYNDCAVWGKYGESLSWLSKGMPVKTMPNSYSKIGNPTPKPNYSFSNKWISVMFSGLFHTLPQISGAFRMLSRVFLFSGRFALVFLFC